jgi:hypothetical protein
MSRIVRPNATVTQPISIEAESRAQDLRERLAAAATADHASTLAAATRSTLVALADLMHLDHAPSARKTTLVRVIAADLTGSAAHPAGDTPPGLGQSGPGAEQTGDRVVKSTYTCAYGQIIAYAVNVPGDDRANG